MNISSTGNTYKRKSTSKDTTHGSGTYKYTVKGSQGLITFKDSSVGDGNVELNFSDKSSGKFRMTLRAEPNSAQYGSFKQLSKSEAADLVSSGSGAKPREIDYGKDCGRGNVFTKTSTRTFITDRRRASTGNEKQVPYGSVSRVDLSENKTYYVYTTWKNLRSKKYEYNYSLYDSENNSIFLRRSYGFDASKKFELNFTTWTTWYKWKPARNAPTGKYTHVMCEGGKRHVMTFQVVR